MYQATARDRVTVERMLACGDSQETIAVALGICVETLCKYFAKELQGGAARARQQVIDMLFRGAKKGNASLIKRLEEMTRFAVAGVELGLGEPARKPERQAKLGKKEVERQEAVAAGSGTEWGEDLAPPPGTTVN